MTAGNCQWFNQESKKSVVLLKDECTQDCLLCLDDEGKKRDEEEL